MRLTNEAAAMMHAIVAADLKGRRPDLIKLNGFIKFSFLSNSIKNAFQHSKGIAFDLSNGSFCRKHTTGAKKSLASANCLLTSQL